MVWNLDFISEEDFKKHVRATIMKYGEKLESYDLKRFNSNLIDPIKLIFDKSVYRTSWEEIVNNEIFRQRDKSNNNDIGYFHQNIFSYFKGCEVPQAGWDVIYRNPDGIQMPDGDIVHTIYVEMKNKHNTMNSASSAKTSYGYYDVKDQQYVITGEKMIMKCGYDENEQKMYVTYVGKITADRRNINIKRSFRIVGQISFVLNSRDWR